jgi:hypothetical protein
VEGLSWGSHGRAKSGSWASGSPVQQIFLATKPLGEARGSTWVAPLVQPVGGPRVGNGGVVQEVEVTQEVECGRRGRGLNMATRTRKGKVTDCFCEERLSIKMKGKEHKNLLAQLVGACLGMWVCKRSWVRNSLGAKCI